MGLQAIHFPLFSLCSFYSLLWCCCLCHGTWLLKTPWKRAWISWRWCWWLFLWFYCWLFVGFPWGNLLMHCCQELSLMQFTGQEALPLVWLWWCSCCCSWYLTSLCSMTSGFPSGQEIEACRFRFEVFLVGFSWQRKIWCKYGSLWKVLVIVWSLKVKVSVSYKPPLQIFVLIHRCISRAVSVR